jgi:hypothetical protein
VTAQTGQISTVIDDWDDFRSLITRTAVRVGVPLNLIWLLVTVARGRFEPNQFLLQCFGFFIIGAVIGALRWARREAAAPLAGTPDKKRRQL